jgi:predicted PurR-regulated permease PerM
MAANGASADLPARPMSHWGALHFVALLLVIAAFWLARELLVPICVALFLGLVANPVVTRLCRWRVPRWIAGMVVVFGGVAIAVALASQLVAPATGWVQRAPQALRQVAPKLRGIVRKVEEANKAAASIVNAAGAGTPAPGTHAARAADAAAAAAAAAEAPKPPSLWSVIRAAPAFLGWFGAVILLGYFFVVFGVDLQYRAIALLPGRQQKKLTHEILRTIEIELSRYVMTISFINAGLALALALAFWLLGLDPGDALLWGAIGGLLNFAPYVGPVIGVVTLGLVGVVAFDSPVKMLMPALCYLALQLLESEVVTPIILGRRWRISPLVVLLWLVFCGWLWSIPGVLLAVPALVSFKIVAERIEGLNGWAKAIG